MNDELQVIDTTAAATAAATASTGLLMPDTTALKARVAAMESMITDLFQDGVHYGKAFPGSDKDSLLQPGAEMVLSAFGIAPCPRVTEVKEPGDHRTFLCEGSLMSNGNPIGTLSATCSTLETKYRYRNRKNTCPKCKQEAVFANRKGAGFYCWTKKGGCGAQFAGGSDEAKVIENQTLGKIENEDPADLYHTCRMMAQKRWLVAIARRTFALSARFVDADGYRNQVFDWKGRGGELLRALPGDKKEVWARVGKYCLQEFGKEALNITNVEGAVVMDWLRANAGGVVAADTAPPDMSPVAPPKGGANGPKNGNGGGDPGPSDPEAQAGPPKVKILSGPQLAKVKAGLKMSKLYFRDVREKVFPGATWNRDEIPAECFEEFMAAISAAVEPLRALTRLSRGLATAAGPAAVDEPGSAEPEDASDEFEAALKDGKA